MSIHTVDSLEKALRIVDEVAMVRKRWGKQANFNYHQSQIVDALVIMRDAYVAADKVAHETVTIAAAADIAISEAKELREALTKANRQLAAANARATKASGKLQTINALQDLKEVIQNG